MPTYKRLGFYLFLILVAAFCLAPLMWQLLISLKLASQITKLPPLLPQTITGKHYVSIFTQHPFARIILNSIIVAGCTTILSMLFGTTAAFALAKLKLKAKLVAGSEGFENIVDKVLVGALGADHAMKMSEFHYKNKLIITG